MSPIYLLFGWKTQLEKTIHLDFGAFFVSSHFFCWEMGDIYTLFGEKETKINWVIVGPARTEFCGVLLACQVQYEDQVVQVPVQKQVHVPMVQTVQKHIEIPQIEYQDEIVEVPVQ